jgi:hypothetical protein
MELPEVLQLALSTDTYEKVGKYSATSMIKPPRQRVLMSRHPERLVLDEEEAVKPLMGTAFHAWMQRYTNPARYLMEERLVEEVPVSDADGVITHEVEISGQPDLYEFSTGTIYDYKTTSAYSYPKLPKPEHEAQLNVYAWLLRRYGYPVQRAGIVAIFTDWSKGRVKDGYPPRPFLCFEVPIWPHTKAERFIMDRVRAHELAERVTDDQLPECSPEERWVNARTGVPTNCASYCPAREVCGQWLRDPANPAGKAAGALL